MGLNPVGEELNERGPDFGLVTVQEVQCFGQRKVENSELLILRHKDGQGPLA